MMRFCRIRLTFTAVLVISIVLNLTLGKDYLTLTHDEKVALDTFKNRVADKVPEDYMKAEIYLLRFLRQTDFNLETAEDLLIAPDVVHSLWELYKHVFTPKLKEITTMFGRKKEQWKKELRSHIPPDQLSKRYGGDKPSAIELFYIRTAGSIISRPEQLQQMNFTNICAKDLKINENLLSEVHHEPGSSNKKRKRCE